MKVKVYIKNKSNPEIIDVPENFWKEWSVRESLLDEKFGKEWSSVHTTDEEQYFVLDQMNYSFIDLGKHYDVKDAIAKAEEFGIGGLNVMTKADWKNFFDRNQHFFNNSVSNKAQFIVECKNPDTIWFVGAWCDTLELAKDIKKRYVSTYTEVRIIEKTTVVITREITD